MTAGAGIDEQPLSDDIKARRAVWENTATSFIDALNALISSQITVDLNTPDPNVILGGLLR